MTEPNHTPLPWKYTGLTGRWPDEAAHVDHVTATESSSVLDIPVKNRTEEARRRAIANAALIVRAVNSHERLVEACRNLLWLIESQHGIDGGHIVADAKAALAASEGREP